MKVRLKVEVSCELMAAEEIINQINKIKNVDSALFEGIYQRYSD
jgi:hypothetical protein